MNAVMDESKKFPSTTGFCCSERFQHMNEDDVRPFVIFTCNLPNGSGRSLDFVCREPSCGALLPTEDNVIIDEETEVPTDPNFFDDGYSLAGRTGFQVWTGTRLMIETLLWRLPNENDYRRLQFWQERIRTGVNILELGAGVGVVGSCLAAAGAHVLLTDLPTLVENSIEPNLERIQSSSAPSSQSACPAWLEPCHGVQIERGWAAATPINWKESLDQQLSKEQSEQVDLIIASDCVFLVEMLQSLLSTAADLFDKSAARQPSLILSFQRRDAKDGDDSQSFTTVNRVIREVKERKWSIECLAWRPVLVGKDRSEVFVFEILPRADPSSDEP